MHVNKCKNGPTRNKIIITVDTESRQQTRMRYNAQEIVKTIWTSDVLADRAGLLFLPARRELAVINNQVSDFCR